MLISYLNLTLRRLAASPFFSSINVMGLSAGFASFFVLWQYTTAELGVDRHYKDYERIGRLGCVWRWNEAVSVGQMLCGSVPVDHMGKIAADFPQVESYVRLDPETFGKSGGYFPFVFSVVNDVNIRTSFKETSVVSADSNFFSFFDIPLVYGDTRNVLSQEHAIAISRSKAEKYFGLGNPVNRTLLLNDSILLKVTGVFEDFDQSTHLQYNFVISNAGYRRYWEEIGRWGNCYFKVVPGTDFKELEQAIQRNKQRYWGEELKVWLLSDGDHFLQPLAEIAFSNHFWGDHFWPRSKFTLRTLLVASFLILFMAWVNYLNLTLSRMGRRWKEIAARKVNGALLGDLLSQFVVEGAVNHALAFAIALTFVQLIRLPLATWFHIEIPDFVNTLGTTWLVIGASIIVGTLLTALYPVYVLMIHKSGSGFRSVDSGTGGIVSFALTTFQYATATALLLWVSAILFQLHFILHRDLGFDRTNVIILDLPNTGTKALQYRVNSFLNTLGSQHPVTFAQSMMGDEDQFLLRIKSPDQKDFFQVDSNGGVDETFLPFFNIGLLAGRNFIANDREDVVVISRYVAERLGHLNPETVIGTKAKVENSKYEFVEIIGVMEDYPLRPYVNYGEETGHPYKTREDGVVLAYKNGNWPDMIPVKAAVRLRPESFQAEVNDVGKTFVAFFPESQFIWTLQEDRINGHYAQELILGRQTSLLTVVAIGIACLGLIGMMANVVEEKTKELGIRKVLGARLKHIIVVLLKPTLRQLTIAILAGFPAGLYLVHQYVNKYSLQVTFRWWHAALPLAILVGTMTAAVSYVLFKAVRANPVESLRYE